MYSGNAVVVNFLMRFPVLIPIAAAVGIATQVPAEVVKNVVPPAVIEFVTPKPVIVPVVKPPLPAIETICPPVKDTAKLKAAEKKALKARGCKVKG